MFLQAMNLEEKEKFLELVYKIANVDGEFAEEEQEILDSYKNELGISEIADTSDIDGLIGYFSDKAMELKRIVFFETIGLINTDEKIESAEAEVLEKMQHVFSIDEVSAKKINNVAKQLQKVYDEIYDAIFDLNV